MQASVLYSIENPHAYAESNLAGFMNVLEACRHHHVEHLVYYASSNSMYGAYRKLPFSVKDPVDHPVSLYAASKKANELMRIAWDARWEGTCCRCSKAMSPTPTPTSRNRGYRPSSSVAQGVRSFVDWYRVFYGV